MSTSGETEDREREVVSLPRPVHPLDESVLVRHHAKILNPAAAVPVFDGSAVLPTIYMPEWLLIPADLLGNMTFTELLESVLTTFGLTPVPEVPRPFDADGPRIPVRLVRIPGRWLERPIDAWTVLQALHIAAPSYPGDMPAAVARVGLRHLFVAQDLSPALTGHPLVGSPGMEGHHDGTGRLPVYLPQMHAPTRTSPEQLGRRPVVAILDTGCGAHLWLDTDTDTGTDPDDDGFVDKSLLPPSPDPESVPDQVHRLMGELDSHSGHGTFLTGIIRQFAPDARVLPVPVMTSEGMVDEANLEIQLQWLLGRVSQGTFIDVVLMAFGGYFEQPAGTASGFGYVLSQLAGEGVILVASAGNDATDAAMYPAAYDFVTGVGALAYTDRTAIYSNIGTGADPNYTEAPGYAIVSTLPTSFQGSRTPQFRHPDLARSGYDPDRFWAGFGIWSGSSFAAGMFAARVASYLSQLPANLEPLTNVSAFAAEQRADWARPKAIAEPWT